MVQFNPTPNPNLPIQEKVQYRKEYATRFYKLESTALKKDLMGAVIGISGTVSSIVAGFGTLSFVRDKTGSLGYGILGVLAVSVIGASTSIIYAIWVGQQRTNYINQLSSLNGTMNDEYADRLKNRPSKIS